MDQVEEPSSTGDADSTANELMTLTSFGSSFEANLAQSLLARNDIDCFLADEAMTDVAWHLGVAVGGVKLQVRRRDVEAAAQLLSQQHEASGEASTAESASPDDAIPVLTDRESSADRAYRTAIFGILFFVIQPYASWLLLKVLFSNERLASTHLRRTIIAAIINIPYIAAFVWVVRSALFAR